MLNTSILEAQNLSKIYRHQTTQLHVLNDINLKIRQGDIVAIVGPSGAGKSTLLHILGGLDCPTKGKVILAGQEIYGLKDTQRTYLRNQKIGFVFQFYHLLPEFTALENVILPALIKGNSDNPCAFEDRGLDLLKKVGLNHRGSHKPAQLSGGEQQRVAIARSLMNEPEIIFCDEPTGNLDSKSGEEIIHLLMTLNKSNGQTLIIVTHDEHIARISQTMFHMVDGKLL